MTTEIQPATDERVGQWEQAASGAAWRWPRLLADAMLALVARIRQEQARQAVLREALASVQSDDCDVPMGGAAENCQHCVIARPLTNPDPAADRLLAEAALGRAYAAWCGENGTETALALTDAHGALIALTQHPAGGEA